nr:MAG TPA: hypothetical protein [Caudoviricetes sp.]
MAGDFKLAELLRKYKPRESQKGKLAKRYRDQLRRMQLVCPV